jgi:hypothetical protein
VNVHTWWGLKGRNMEQIINVVYLRKSCAEGNNYNRYYRYVSWTARTKLHFCMAVNMKRPQNLGPEVIWLGVQSHIYLILNFCQERETSTSCRNWESNVFRGHDSQLRSPRKFRVRNRPKPVRTLYSAILFSRLKTMKNITTPSFSSPPPYIGGKIIPSSQCFHLQCTRDSH